jgi:hypothetical protein
MILLNPLGFGNYNILKYPMVPSAIPNLGYMFLVIMIFIPLYIF